MSRISPLKNLLKSAKDLEQPALLNYSYHTTNYCLNHNNASQNKARDSVYFPKQLADKKILPSNALTLFSKMDSNVEVKDLNLFLKINEKKKTKE